MILLHEVLHKFDASVVVKCYSEYPKKCFEYDAMTFVKMKVDFTDVKARPFNDFRQAFE